MKLLLARILLRLIGCLPLLVIRMLAIGIGQLIHVWPGRPFRRTKQRIIEHLRLAFPEKSEAELRELQRKNLIEMLSTALESGALWYRPAEWLKQRVEISGWEYLEQAQQSGRGVLFVSGHLGNWEAAALYMTTRLPIVYLYKAPKSKKVDQLLTQRRARFGGEFVPAGSPALRKMLSTLKRGGVAGLLFDQLPKTGDFVPAPFFGQSVETMTLVHELVKRTSCQLLFCDFIRRPDSKGWSATIRALPDEFSNLDPLQAATLLNAELEQSIRTAIEQYLWQYRRFSN